MNDEEHGLDTFIERQNEHLFVSFASEHPRGKKRKLEMDPVPIACQRALVCRGTVCYLAKRPRTKEYDSVFKPTSG